MGLIRLARQLYGGQKLEGGEKSIVHKTKELTLSRLEIEHVAV